MKPFEINYLLKKNESSQTKIATQLNVKPHTVNNVISGRATSKRIADAVAKTVGLKTAEMFPQYSHAA